MRVGVFDSGLGGLSIFNPLQKRFPNLDLIYLADQANFPYGSRSIDEIVNLTRQGVKRLEKLDCKLVVLACNTVTTNAIEILRQEFPEIKFVGVVPPVKPAAAQAKGEGILVLATPATCQSRSFQDLVERWSGQSELTSLVCPGLVELIEAGQTKAIKKYLAEKITPLINQKNIGLVVSGCTHFPLVSDLIKKAIKPAVFIEPSQPVIDQIERLLTSFEGGGERHYLTTGDEKRFGDQLSLLVGKR